MTTINKSEKILVIGGSSLDTLTIKGKDHSSPGGAGLYTALAAAKSGADVTRLSPFPSTVSATLLEFSSHVKLIVQRSVLTNYQDSTSFMLMEKQNINAHFLERKER